MKDKADKRWQMGKEHRIIRTLPGSIAEELNIQENDVLLCVNGREIEDIFDYQYWMNDEKVTVLIRKPNDEEWEFDIEKDYGEDLGVEFENGLMDDYKSCRNKCMFCFIDQMPKGMRDTLYFKDDDSRLSFLQGNYVTLTNMNERDIERIIYYHLEPINISVHTTNPALRCRMLNNRFAGDALSKIQMLKDAGIKMNGQIVLCKGINDGEELEKSIRDLTALIPQMKSLSVVPAGLTKYREGLYPLEPFTKADAKEVIAQIQKWQRHCMKTHGIHFVHAGDEWYLLAEEEIPPEETYDGYLQLENGVGMMRLLENEFGEALMPLEYDDKRSERITIATGKLAAPLIEKLSALFMRKFPNVKVCVIPVKNNFFGEKITVSGLLTGRDILEQLKDISLGDRLLLPCNLLRSGEEVFLDDVTLSEVKNALQVQVDIVKSSGQDLIYALLDSEKGERYE